MVPEVVRAHLEGDVSFLIGGKENGKDIRMSSTVLSLVSSVIAALFGPKYSEGMASANASSVRKIELPDDDPDAMTLVCYALHHHRSALQDITPELREKVAVLCNKYDLASVLTSWL